MADQITYKPWAEMADEEAREAIKAIAKDCSSRRELHEELTRQIPGYCEAEHAICYYKGQFSILVHGPQGELLNLITP